MALFLRLTPPFAQPCCKDQGAAQQQDEPRGQDRHLSHVTCFVGVARGQPDPSTSGCRAPDTYVADAGQAVFDPRDTTAQGRKDAQYFIGFMHYAGQGVDRDQSLAAEWFLKAAAQGQPDAQFNLGFQYEKGECVGKDEAMAVQWCKFC